MRAENHSNAFSHRERSASETMDGKDPEISTGGIPALAAVPNKLVQKFAELSFLPFDSKVEIPTVVITGDQSAGKSSLIEAITGIDVPRDAGTCTRCPFHVSMTEASTWSCKVFIEKIYDFTGRITGSGRAEFDQWEQKPEPVSIFFEDIEHPTQVENVLRRAQLAVLNPQIDPKLFKVCNEQTSSGVQPQEFSPNVVRLDLHGPDYTDLSFFDLPGVISAAKPGQHHLPNLVKNLIRKYIRPQANIVLLAIPMHNDVENCAALSLIREARAESRCLGVLTKPDRMQRGDPLDAWIALLEGKEHQLGHGYFVTKQPSQEEKACKSHSAARAAEAHYFENEAPSPLQQFLSQCTTTRLQAKLSELLIDAIKGCAPNIKNQVESKLLQVHKDLALLPSAPGDNALSLVYDFLSTLSKQFQEAFNGQSQQNEFMLEWRTLVKHLQSEMHEARPKLIIKEALEPPIVISDDESDTNNSPVSPQKRSKTSSATSPSKRAKISTVIPTGAGMRIRLNEIRIELEDLTGNKLQNQADAAVASIIVRKARIPWRALVREFVDQTEKMVNDECLRAVKSSLGSWRDTPLRIETSRHVSGYITARSAVLYDSVKHLLDAEMEEPHTFDRETEDYYYQKEREHFVSRRLEDASGNVLAGNVGTSVPKSKGNNIKHAAFDDPFKHEIDVMAKARAYYKLASASLIDQVAKAVILDVFQEIRKEMDKYLREALEVNGNEAMSNAKRLLEQDESVARRRSDLMKEKATYERANEILKSIGKFSA